MATVLVNNLEMKSIFKRKLGVEYKILKQHQNKPSPCLPPSGIMDN